MNCHEIKLSAESPFSPDAVTLMNELSACLESITGNSGKNSFNAEDVCSERSIFVIARNRNGEAVGCGAFRSIDKNAAELKRIYAKVKSKGIGTKILCFLELEAKKMDYKSLCLETRLINSKAVSFYERNGYKGIPNYGKYVNNDEAVCFEKHI